MIISMTPFRMSFFGGGTDIADFYKVHGGSVLSTTFDKYCYVTVRHLPRFFSYSSEFVYSNIERVQKIEEIQHPLIRNIMQYMDMREIRLAYDADLPARTGLGTSSSFAVGMINAFYALKGKRVDDRKLADEAIFLERELCGEAGGIQDQIAVAFGGLNRIDMDRDGYKVRPLIISNQRRDELDANLLLFFTGFTRLSADVQRKTKSSLSEKTAQLLEMKSIVDTAEDILVSQKSLHEFGKLLDVAWQLKRGLSDEISTSLIDEIYTEAMKAGALGGKLLGAGGGGFLLFYVEQERQQMVLDAMRKLLHVPFRFETGGSRILYYSAEDYEI